MPAWASGPVYGSSMPIFSVPPAAALAAGLAEAAVDAAALAAGLAEAEAAALGFAAADAGAAALDTGAAEGAAAPPQAPSARMIAKLVGNSFSNRMAAIVPYARRTSPCSC